MGVVSYTSLLLPIIIGFHLFPGLTRVVSGDNIPAGLLSTAELMVGILAASMPTYRPLWRHLRHDENHGSTDASNSGYGYRFENSKNTVNITGGRGSVPLSGVGINVTNQVEMSVHPNHRDEWMRVSDETDDDQHRLTTQYGRAVSTPEGVQRS